MTRHLALAVLVAFGLAAAAPAAPEGTVVVGSKTFTESRLLAEMMAQLLEAATDLKVERRLGLGGTKVAFTALQTGQIDVYAEYTGTGWAVQLGRTDPVGDPIRAYLVVDEEFRKRWQLEWLMPFGFNNTYAMALRQEVAERLGVETLSELAPHIDQITIGVSHEFLSRDDGFPGLAKAYGLKIPADLRGMEHGLAYEGLRSGAVDLVDAYSTDGKLERFKVRVLKDDKEFFPPYHCAPVIRSATLARYPEVGPVLERLGYALDDATMRRLNYEVEVEGGSFAGVAQKFLTGRGLLSADGPARRGVRRDQGWLGYLWQTRGKTWRHVVQHLWLTACGEGLAILVAIPLGLWLTRREALAPFVLGATGVIQTIPSLALLAFMIPIPGLGLGFRSAVAALFLYALLPILRNTYTGVREVDSKLIEAARGMGLRDREILLRVELPLATRTIMAGVRTSTVISVGVATLAAFVGAGGLGEPILTGLQLNDTRLVLTGAVPAAGLAVLVDLGLAGLEGWLVPRGLEAPGGDA